MRLTIVRGLPGSGKSTFAKEKFPGILHLENDMLHMADGKYQFVESKAGPRQVLLRELCSLAIENGSDVVVSNVFVSRRAVDIYRAIAEVHGAEFKVYRMDNDFGNVHNVPAKVYACMHKDFQDYPGEEVVKSNG